MSPRPPSVHHRAGSYRLGPPRTRPAQRPCAKPSPCPGSGARGGDAGQSRGGAPRCPPDGGPGSASRWRPDRALRPPAPRACPAGGDTSLGPLRRLRLPGRLGGRGRGHCLAPSGGSDHLACQFEDRASLNTCVVLLRVSEHLLQETAGNGFPAVWPSGPQTVWSFPVSVIFWELPWPAPG